MYVEVHLTGKPLDKRTILPRRAIHGDHVNLVNPKNRLERRSIQIEFFQEDIAVVASGIRPGEKVIAHDIVPAIEGMLLEPEEDREMKHWLKQAAAGKN